MQGHLTMTIHPHRPAGEPRSLARGTAYGVVGLVLASTLGGCVTSNGSNTVAESRSPEFYEFANMRASNIVPKSSAAAFVGAFERFCLDAGQDAVDTAGALRAADYVAGPRRNGDTMTAFVVDDRRPMVQISDDGRFCAVVAEARTGQSARVRRMVSRRFAGAQPLPTNAPGTELAVRVAGDHAGLIELRRLAPADSGSRVILAILRAS